MFASAKSPGGGFRSGARAQGESLARAPALCACRLAVPAGFGQIVSAVYDRQPGTPVRKTFSDILTADIPRGRASRGGARRGVRLACGRTEMDADGPAGHREDPRYA